TVEQDHILHLTARILKRTVSRSDEEWSIALLAVNEAIDSYEEERGKFWSYAALIIGSRIKDHYRAISKYQNEISISASSFGDDLEEEDMQLGVQIEIREKTAVYVDTTLRDELEEFSKELTKYDIDLFELPKFAPKSQKTRQSCREIIKAIFLPPPIVDLLYKTKNLPVKEILERVDVKRKLIDRHRKYLIASTLVEAGDYPKMQPFVAGND
ncbi:MAG: hypothetical protein K6E91_07180, partial [Butyrivibrio sp.]|nr:hypothetical protein [Butyrivibrio sp.]